MTEIENRTAIILRALDSEVRRELIKIALSKGPLDADNYYNEILARNFQIKYKESVYKELQLLVEAELLDKYYDIKSKKIKYKLSANKVIIDLKSMECHIIKEN